MAGNCGNQGKCGNQGNRHNTMDLVTDIYQLHIGNSGW